MSDDARPVGIRQVSAYLRVSNAAAAIKFYMNVFDACEILRLTEPNDRIAHCELRCGPATIMVSDEYPEQGIMCPTVFGGTSVAIYLNVTDVDALYSKAIAADAVSVMEPTDQFYGERVAKIKDPFGHEWLLSQTVEELSPLEMQGRFDRLCGD